MHICAYTFTSHVFVDLHIDVHEQVCTCTYYCVGDLNRGESMSCQRRNLVATVWRDRKLVYVMSTNSDPQNDSTVQRKERDGTSVTVPCPASVVATISSWGE